MCDKIGRVSNLTGKIKEEKSSNLLTNEEPVGSTRKYYGKYSVVQKEHMFLK
jgi:hypothetical protein